MTDFLPIISSPPSERRQYSHAFKRQIVEATLVSGASIAGVALLHGINANLLHKWRCRYRRGEYGVAADPSILLPVQIVSPARLASAHASQPNHSNQTALLTDSNGHIELLMNETRVLIHGAPDRQTLRNVIEALRT